MYFLSTSNFDATEKAGILIKLINFLKIFFPLIDNSRIINDYHYDQSYIG